MRSGLTICSTTPLARNTGPAFSFSKSYSLAGFRVGSVIAGEWLLDEITKVQDCVSICAAQVSQVAAEFALTHLAGEVEGGRADGRSVPNLHPPSMWAIRVRYCLGRCWFAYLNTL